MDSGVRDSIKAGIGYVGLALALLFAITTAGIDLSSLAIVAGALSLGIGFGLQNIVSNFVSGLILLIERPIKVGDWVEVGGTAGHVKKVSVRATEIITFQKQSIIVPNSELINSVVGNWTHKDKGGRVDISIGVAYGTNTRQIETLLLDIARGRHDVLKFPEPVVIFIGFGDSSLDFELRIFLRDIGQGVVVASEIRHTIAEVFEKENIEIPFPQRDLNIKSLQVNNDVLLLKDEKI
jgi:small-conductance mechanosensitive channel